MPADPLSLGTAAARTLATTTKSVPQARGITPRWLLRMLPWVEASGGTYRVNARLTVTTAPGLIAFAGADSAVTAADLRQLPPLRDFDGEATLSELAGRFTRRRVEAGEVIAESGRPADQVCLIVHGKVRKTGTGPYGGETSAGTLADGQYFGEQALTDPSATWEFTARAVTACTLLTLPRAEFDEQAGRSGGLADHLDGYRARAATPHNRRGEADIAIAAGHSGEPGLPGTFADYETSPREYELSVAQTVLRVHSRVADLYNDPMDQVTQQLRLTVEALRERQEAELLTNPDFGLLANAAPDQRIHAHGGPPAPADLDDLLCRRRQTRFFLAHPRAIAAFGRECTRRGIYPDTAEVHGSRVMAWRGVPVLPCPKIPVAGGTTSILAMRTGDKDEGVIGLHRTGLPDEHEPGLNVRFRGIDSEGILSYLVSAYYSAAILVPDALGVLDNVEVGHLPGRGALHTAARGWQNHGMARVPRRPSTVAVAACAVALLAAGCSSVRSSLKQVGSGVHTPAARTYTVTGEVTALTLDTAGSISVTGTAPGGPVTVTESPSYTAARPVTSHTVSRSGQLTLGYTCKTQLVCSVSYNIKVPRGTAVHAEGREGTVTLSSLAGPVTARTVTGFINANGMSSPSAELNSGAGGINATFTTAPASLKASTHAGSITISVPGQDTYQVSADAIVGTTHVTVRQAAKSAHAITAHSDLGGITINPS